MLRGLVALVLLAAVASPAAAQQPNDDDSVAPSIAKAIAADIVLRGERALVDALHRRDRRQLDGLLADDYVLRSAPDIHRAEWIRNAMTLCWGDRSDIAGFTAQAHGDVVVTSFVLTFYVDPGSCRPAVLRSLITDVWTRHDTGWRLSVRHSGAVPPSGEAIVAQYGVVQAVPPLWDLRGELSFVATGGNTSTRTVGLGADLSHRGEHNVSRMTVSFLTSEAERVTQARSVTAQVRHGVRIGDRSELFGRVDFARDRFAGIENRMTAEFGAAYTPRLPRRHALTTDVGLGYTLERRLEAADFRFLSASGGVEYVWTLAPGTDLRNDISLVADLESPANWRVTNAFALSVALTRVLSLKATQALERRNVPVPGFERTDLRSSAALVVRLQRFPPIR